MGDFSFPSYYNFPPFYTIQPVASIREKQLKLWCDFLTSYLKAHNKWSISVQEDAKTELFFNASLNRALPTEGIQAVLQELCSLGHAEWDDAKQTQCTVSYKTFGDWAEVLYTWAQQNSYINQISTIYELHAGEESTGAAFHGLPQAVIVASLRVLQTQGRVLLIAGQDVSEMGVKFLPAQ